MMRYHVSKAELETICLMALRDILGPVRSVRVSPVRARIGECNWELQYIEPAPPPSRCGEAITRIRELQAAFKIDPLISEVGHGGLFEVPCKERRVVKSVREGCPITSPSLN